MPEPRTLAYDQIIRLAGWRSNVYASVFTTEGYARAYGEDPALAVARTIARGDQLADSIFCGSTLTDSMAFQEADRAKAATAVVLEPGERVLIEGRLYEVWPTDVTCRLHPNYSNPIRFAPVTVEG